MLRSDGIWWDGTVARIGLMLARGLFKGSTRSKEVRGQNFCYKLESAKYST